MRAVLRAKRLRNLLAAFVGMVALIGAGCSKDSGPVTVHIYSLNPASQKYEYFDAYLSTLDDVTQMRGQVVAMKGGATLVADALISDPKDPRAFSAQGGSAPDCSFVQKNGVLYPRDFDSGAMAAAYFELERARAFYVSLGVDTNALNTLSAYYNPNLQIFTTLVPTFWYMTDNEAYVPSNDGFLIVPHLLLQDLPFSNNQGVLTHEYGHKVHNHYVDHNSRTPHWLEDGWTTAASNQFRSEDEGLADVFGGTLTQDPNFIAPSVASQPNLIDRDMSKVRIMSQSDVNLALGLGATDAKGNSLSFDPHQTGAFVAATMWQLGVDLNDHQKVAKAILANEQVMGEAIVNSPKPFDYSLTVFWNHFAQQFQGSDHDDLCNLLKARFAVLIATDTKHPLTACP
jgi:hypothetical protein